MIDIINLLIEGCFLFGSLGCFLFGLQKVYFIVYEQKDAKLKFRIIPLIFATFCKHVLNNGLLKSGRESLRGPLGVSFPRGLAV